jgi:hypothetical protein
MASAAEPSYPSQPLLLPLEGDRNSAAAAVAADPNAVQPQQLIPDDPNPPDTGGPLPPAFLPLLSTQFIIPSSPPAATAGSSSSSPAPASYASVYLTPDNCSGGKCTGFRVANSAEQGVNSTANSVVLIPARNETMIDPMSGGLYEIATLRLHNGGLMAPAGARMITVPIRTKTMLQVPGLNKPAIINLRFNVM